MLKLSAANAANAEQNMSAANIINMNSAVPPSVGKFCNPTKIF
jgi:hypothetical protein